MAIINRCSLWGQGLGRATPGLDNHPDQTPSLTALASRGDFACRSAVTPIIEPSIPCQLIRTGGFQGPVSTQRRPANIFGQRGVVRFGAMRISRAAPPFRSREVRTARGYVNVNGKPFSAASVASMLGA